MVSIIEDYQHSAIVRNENINLSQDLVGAKVIGFRIALEACGVDITKEVGTEIPTIIQV